MAGGEQETHRFTSYDREADTGLDYAMNRWYSPSLGRFLSADPYRASGGPPAPQSWNRYAYSRNDPVNRVDPLGREDGPVNGGDLGSVTITASANGGTISAAGASMIGIVGRGVVEPVLDGDGGGGSVVLPDRGMELLKRYGLLKDRVLEKGRCGEALKQFLPAVNGLATSNKLQVLDAGDPRVAKQALPGQETTVGEYFSSRPAAGYTWTITTKKQVPSVQIFLGPEFFNQNENFQAVGFFHELLHGALNSNDEGLALKLGVHPREGESSSDAISRWLDDGCPASG